MNRKILVTGGAGFIGSNLIRLILAETRHHVLNLDKLTYAGHLESLASVSSNPKYQFSQTDISDRLRVEQAFQDFQPDWVIHLAAETHVDRSIADPAPFIESNMVGTYVLLESSRRYFGQLAPDRKSRFRFLQASTDEVYGTLKTAESAFTETSCYAPNSPYSASKAAADHLVRAWHQTYRLPVLVTLCSNNYGPFQFPEKLIPVVILNAIKGRKIPVYGNGQNVRDWIHVLDHARAMLNVIEFGVVGESYNIGGNFCLSNIELVGKLCAILDDELPVAENDRLTGEQKPGSGSYSDLIEFVPDRPGHDFRYAMNINKISQGPGWRPQIPPDDGLVETVRWYLDNETWCAQVESDRSRDRSAT